MNHRTATTLAFSLALTSATAHAQTPDAAGGQGGPDSNLYVNVGVAVPGNDSPAGDTVAALARVGTGLGQSGIGRFFAVEGELAIGLSEASDTLSGEFPAERRRFDDSFSSRLNAAAGVFGVARAPVSDRGHLFVRMGYAAFDFDETARVTTTVDGVVVEEFDFDDSVSTDGFAAGVGAELFWGRSRRNGLRADVMAVVERTGFDSDGYAEFDNATAVTLAYVRRF